MDNAVNFSDKEEPISRFIKDAWRYLPVAVLPSVLALIAGAIFTRLFNPETYGMYTFALAVTVPLVTLLTEWSAQPIGRFYSDYVERNEKDLFLRLVATFTLLSICILSLVFFIIIITVFLMSGGISHLSMYLGAFAYMLTQCFLSTALPILPASFQPKSYRFYVISSSVLSVALSFAFVWFLKKDIAFLFWGQAIANLVFIPYVHKKSGVRLNRLINVFNSWTKESIRRFIHYGTPMMLWFFASNMLNTSDRFLIQLFRSSSEVGIYGVNYNLIAGMIGIVNIPVNLAVGPILFRQWRNHSFAQAENTILRMTELHFLLALLGLAGLLVTAEPLVAVLLGEEFREGVVIFGPVLLARVIWGASVLGQRSLELNERTDIILKNVLFALASNVIMNFLLIPVYGYIAAAYTTLFSNIIYAFLVWFHSRSFIGWKVEKINYIPYVLSFIFSISAGFIVIHIPSNDLLKIIIGGVTVATIYGLSILVFARNRLKTVI